MERHDRVLGIRVIRELAFALGIGPALAPAVLDDHRLDQPVDVVLDPLPVYVLAEFGKHHGLERDHVGYIGFDLPEVR